MATNEIAIFLQYANMQMAAEALLDVPRPGGFVEQLKIGNTHASKFPTTLASEFASKYEVVAHQPNTGTGFSGTLLRYIGPDDPLTGIKNGDLTISFRSTEFIDDAVRDNQATNKMEIQQSGWAFGQIDDMEKWYAQLQASGKIGATDKLTVTGYSLGGHLATAFNLLRQEDAQLKGIANPIKNTYTFNGAGVGDIKTGQTLTSVIVDFERMRTNASGQEIVFSNTQVKALYESLRTTQFTTVESVDTAVAQTLLLRSNANPAECDRLLDALTRIRDIVKETLRVPGIASGSSDPGPVAVQAAQVDAARLDYQLAVLAVAKNTSTYRTDPVSGAIDGYVGRNTKGSGIPGFFDLYGAPAPSAVSNSQWHYGKATPIYVEDQPLFRGNVIFNAAVQSFLHNDIKLLVPDYTHNDFGDTHSLVLMVDSLSVMNLFAQLDPNAKLADVAAILQVTTATKSQTSIGTQGKAEGDTLETALDALYKLFTGTDPNLRKTAGLNDGNTWADSVRREQFYTKLNALQIVLQPLVGTARIESFVGKSQSGLVGLAKNGDIDAIAYRYAIKAGNPFAILGVDYTQHNTEGALEVFDEDTRPDGQLTDQYLKDRSAYVSWLIKANTKDMTTLLGTANGYNGVDDWLFTDKIKDQTLTVRGLAVLGNKPTHQVIFGNDDNNTDINGGDSSDYIYGGAGDDNIGGRKGADYLEGNAGNDVLDGGENADTLVGGTGDDIFYGGKDNDVLNGGLGTDTYVFTNGDGWDWIEDKDGLGSITYDSLTLGTDIKKIPNTNNIWQQTDANTGKTITYSLYDRTEGNETYKVLSIQGSNGGMWVKRWVPGKLGITLPDAIPETPPPAAAPIPVNLSNAWYAPLHNVIDLSAQRLERHPCRPAGRAHLL